MSEHAHPTLTTTTSTSHTHTHTPRHSRCCHNCKIGDEQYCSGNGALGSAVFTYNFRLPTGELVYGGYSQAIVTDEAYTLHIPDNLDLAASAPLLCAGITVWSPFVHYGVRSHHAVGVVGLGGLGARVAAVSWDGAFSTQSSV